MIKITRSLARQLRAMFQRAGIRKTNHGETPRVRFRAGPDGLHVQAQRDGVAIEYHDSAAREPDELLAPVDVLIQWEGRGQDSVCLEKSGPDRLVANWTDRGMPQLIDVDASPLRHAAAFPEVPTTFVVNEPDLLPALRSAVPVTDQESHRYALGCLHLDGAAGRIAATDGRHLLVQSGFQFPWEQALLVPGGKIFTCKELPEGEPVHVGSTESHAAFRIGPWTILLAINKDGRFPKVYEIVRDPASASSWLRLTESDAKFLATALPRLPCSDLNHLPVTLDLNGQVAFRAKPEGKGQPSELVLTNSRLDGAPLILNTNREHLARAIQLGFREFCFAGNDSPVFCDDGRRHYLWMPLDAEGAVGASADMTRLESPAGEPVSSTQSTQTPRRRFTVKRPPVDATRSLAAADSSTRAAQKPTDSGISGSPLAQALALRTALRASLVQNGQLIQALKRQKQQAKLVATTLESLKALQKVAG